MFFTNKDCEIRSKKSKVEEGKEYRYIEFGNREMGSLFFSTNIKKFEKINVGFHNKLSIGKSQKNNPKLVYAPDDTDLYMLLYGEDGNAITVEGDKKDSLEVLASVKIKKIEELDDKNNETFNHIILVKILPDSNITFVLGDGKYTNVNNNFVKSLDTFEPECDMIKL